jgi:hypothetical protein
VAVQHRHHRGARRRPLVAASNPRDTVEDQVQAILEVVPGVIARLHDVPGKDLDLLGYSSGGNGSSIRLRDLPASSEFSNGRFIFVSTKP